MIQFIKFACLDPMGEILLNVKTIVGVLPTEDNDQSVIVTPHGNYRVLGSTPHFTELFRSLFGGEWDGIPSSEPIE